MVEYDTCSFLFMEIMLSTMGTDAVFEDPWNYEKGTKRMRKSVSVGQHLTLHTSPWPTFALDSKKV